MKYFNQQGIEGVPLVLITYTGMCLVFLPILIKQYQLWYNNLKLMALLFVLGGLANLSFATAIVYGDVVRVMVLFYLIPAWGVLGGWYFLKERIDKIRWFAVFLALFGAFIILGGTHIFQTSPSWIDILAILAGFTLSMNNVAFRASPELPVISKISATFIGCFVTASVLMLFQVQPMPDVSWLNIFLMTAFGLCWLLIATLATQWAVTRLEVGRASILIIMELFTAVISAMWIGGERLSLQETLGGLLIIIAAVLEARRKSQATNLFYVK